MSVFILIVTAAVHHIFISRILLSSSGENLKTYKGVTLTNRRQSRLVPEAIPNRSDHFNKILDDTVKYLDSRFANLSEEPLSCFDIFDISKLPHDREAMSVYGDKDIELLVKHFEPVLTADEIESIPDEWSDLKTWMAAYRGVGRFLHLYGDLLRERPPHLSKVLVLVEALLTLSPSTAACERGFSTMNRVKTSHRTSLRSDTLNNLMLISTDGCRVDEYSPDKAVEHWFFSAKGTRHLHHRTPVGAHETANVEVEEESEYEDFADTEGGLGSESEDIMPTEESDSDF